MPIKLVTIPDDKYSDYRYEVIFKTYKWDPQVEDHNTVSKHVVLMDQETANQLEDWAEKLSAETFQMEEALNRDLALAKNLGLPKKINKALRLSKNYDPQNNLRLMRFDFHPTNTSWAVSEVNSDVPGGFAEASILPQIASKYFDGYESRNHLAHSLFEAFKEKVKEGGRIGLVHATAYSDDRQVMQYISDYFEERNLKTILLAPDHIKWVNKKPVCIVQGQEGDIDGIMRFFPLEWLNNLPKKSKWNGYYECLVPSCSHPIAIFAQSKRLPLVWDNLGINIPTWKELLPTTINPKLIKQFSGDWIYKPALGRVGEGISIKSVVPKAELIKITKAAKKEPKNWVAQQMFYSQPLTTLDNQSFHLCVGVFTVNGKRAGFYGRISPYERIDANAKDIPILVVKEKVYER